MAIKAILNVALRPPSSVKSFSLLFEKIKSLRTREHNAEEPIVSRCLSENHLSAYRRFISFVRNLANIWPSVRLVSFGHLESAFLVEEFRNFFFTFPVSTPIATTRHFTMSICSDEFTAKFRKVRKGAHSCQECRRRKVKCIYATPDDLTCIVCERRGARCISQYYSHELNNPFERPRRTKAKLKGNDTHLAGDSDMIEANPTYTDEPKTPLGGLPTSRRASISSQSVHRSIKVGRKVPNSD